MSRGIVLCVALGCFGFKAQAETCSGPSDDGSTYYDVTVTKGGNGKPSRTVLVENDQVTLGDFWLFDDITPKPPTDERYRYVFRDEHSAPGDVAVMLMEGGFTQRLSAQIWILPAGAAEPEALATLNCQR